MYENKKSKKKSRRSFIHQASGAMGIVAVAALSIVGTYIIVKIVQAIIGLRVSSKEAQEGLDITTHGERGYHL